MKTRQASVNISSIPKHTEAILKLPMNSTVIARGSNIPRTTIAELRAHKRKISNLCISTGIKFEKYYQKLQIGNKK